MKSCILQMIFVCLSASLPAAALLPKTDEPPNTRYNLYSVLPKSGPGSFGGSTGITDGIGDTRDSTPKNVGLFLIFDTDDAFRTSLQSNNPRIILKTKVGSLINGGAPTPITLALLDAASDLSKTSAGSTAWLSAPHLTTITTTLDQTAVGQIQTFDITEIIRPYIAQNTSTRSGIIFGMYPSMASDNDEANQTTLNLSATSLEVTADSPTLPAVTIGSAIRLDVSTQVGNTYFIESSADLATWTRDPQGIAGTGSQLTIYRPVTETRRFYRIVVQN